VLFHWLRQAEKWSQQTVTVPPRSIPKADLPCVLVGLHDWQYQIFQSNAQSFGQFGQGINSRLVSINFPILDRVDGDSRALCKARLGKLCLIPKPL